MTAKRVEEVIAGALTDDEAVQIFRGCRSGGSTAAALQHVILAACRKAGVTGEMVRACVLPSGNPETISLHGCHHKECRPAILLLPEAKGDVTGNPTPSPFEIDTTGQPTPPEPETVTVEAFATKEQIDALRTGDIGVMNLHPWCAPTATAIPVRITLPAAPKKPKRTDPEKLAAVEHVLNGIREEHGIDRAHAAITKALGIITGMEE